MCGVWRNKTMQASQRGNCHHSQPASHIWATRAHNIYTTWPGSNTHPCIEGTQQAPHGRQQADHSPAAKIGCRSRRMCGVGRNKTMQASQRGKCQHSPPASRIWATRAHNIYTTWPGSNTHPCIEGTQQAPHGRQQADHSPAAKIGCRSRRMCGVGRNKTMQASQRGKCQHSPPASRIWATRAHNIYTTWPGSNTHLCIEGTLQAPHGGKQADHSLAAEKGCRSRCMCGVGRKKTKQAGQRGNCHHSLPASHVCATRATNIYTTWPGSNTYTRIEGTQPAPHGRQQADHSLAAEMGGAKMHVWCWAKQNKTGRSQGHMPA